MLLNKIPNGYGNCFQKLEKKYCSKTEQKKLFQIIMHNKISKHLIDYKELKIVICWICSMRRPYLMDLKAILITNILTGEVAF